jgi:hypothetical protein
VTGQAEPVGIAQGDYAVWCRLLGLPFDPALRPLEREAALPAWATLALIATAAAQERLALWSAAGSRENTPDDLVRRLRFLGDDGIRSIVLGVLHEDVAPPAAAYLLANALFVGCGLTARGWMIRAAPPAASLFVLVSGASGDRAEVRSILLHEAAHAWLMAEPAPLPAIEDVFAEVTAGLLRAADRPELMGGIFRDEVRDERQADELARAWGGSIRDSDVRASRQTRLTAAALAAKYRP